MNSLSPRWAQITDKLRKELWALGGLDIVHPFAVQWYNKELQDSASHATGASSLPPLPTHGRNSTLGIIVGNTKRWWPHVAAGVVDPESRRVPLNPLDTFAASTIIDAVTSTLSAYPINSLNPNDPTHSSDPADSPRESSLAAQGATVRWTGDIRKHRIVAFQRLASAAGLAFLHNAAHLNIHSVYGPWLAFRAVVVLDVDGPPLSSQYICPDPVPALHDSLTEVTQEAIDLSRGTGSGRPDSPIRVDMKTWEAFLAVRKLIPVGEEDWKYNMRQIRYHYAHDVQSLVDEGVDAHNQGLSGCPQRDGIPTPSLAPPSQESAPYTWIGSDTSS